MKKQAIIFFTVLAVSQLLLAGCRDSEQLIQATLDSEASVLTVDGVSYLRDESLISNTAGSGRWKYDMSRHEQIASAKENGKRYLIDAGEEERYFLFGHYDQYYFSAIPYDIWFREELGEELSGPLTGEKLFSDMLSGEQLEQLLALYSEEETSDSFSYDDMVAETDAFDVEGFRTQRTVSLNHRAMDGLSFQILFYFSARTGMPYLQCRDGLFRPCPRELTDALELSPELPVLLAMTEDDPGFAILLDELSAGYGTEGISPNDLARACKEEQILRDLEFRIDIYSREDDGWPLYWLKGYFHPRTGIPYLSFEDGFLRRMSRAAADSLGLKTAFRQQKEESPYSQPES